MRYSRQKSRATSYTCTSIRFGNIERNRLREIFVDHKTFELHRLIGTDKLFIVGGGPTKVYPATDTITMGTVAGYPVVTHVHAVIGGGYDDDGKEIDIHVYEIEVPPTLPAWYFRSAYLRAARRRPPL